MTVLYFYAILNVWLILSSLFITEGYGESLYGYVVLNGVASFNIPM